jgi:hypothetical protein
MDSTSHSLAKVEKQEEKGVAKAKTLRGMSAKACSTKALTWTLELSKALSTHNASTKDTCDSQTITRTTDA